jgi:phosphate transport system substrate-binding protein
MAGTRKTWVTTILAFVSLSLFGATCVALVSWAGAGPTGNDDLDGTIVISGSSTVQPISSLTAELFNEDVAPNVAIIVDGPGTGDGFELFCRAETDISDASRPIEQEEIDACAQNGVNYVELEVAFDGITVMTSPGNASVGCLNLGDLYALLGPESAGIDTWVGANVLASEVGGTGGFPTASLEITAPGEESGTYDAFVELSGIEDVALDRGVPEDEAASLRKDYQASPDDNVIIAAIEGSSSALGFAGFAFAEEAGDRVKEIQIDGGDGCVSASRESIADGSYPLSRSLYVYVNRDKATESPALQAFMDYYLSDTGLGDVVTEVGYVGLPPDRVAATRAAWNDGRVAEQG